MVKHFYIKILPHEAVRDPAIEHKLIELARERVIYGLLLIGAIMMLMAVMW